MEDLEAIKNARFRAICREQKSGVEKTVSGEDISDLKENVLDNLISNLCVGNCCTENDKRGLRVISYSTGKIYLVLSPLDAEKNKRLDPVKRREFYNELRKGIWRYIETLDY